MKEKENERTFYEVLEARKRKLIKKSNKIIKNYLDSSYLDRDLDIIVNAERKLEAILSILPQRKDLGKPVIQTIDEYIQLREQGMSFQDISKKYRGIKQHSLLGFETHYSNCKRNQSGS